jgi:LuxR family maltose regulon positive regulatory protein
MLHAMIQRGILADTAARLLAAYGTWASHRQVLTPTNRTTADNLVMLTEREEEVLVLLAEQLSNKEIARRLDISPLTVRNHASNLYSKLNVTTRKQAVSQARALHLLRP